MVYASASEILFDAGVYALGSSITSKLSAKVAQGVGTGALTTRLGLQVIDQCRSLGWLDRQRPTLSSMTSHLLTNLQAL